MLEVVDLLEKRKQELELELRETSSLITSPTYHSSRTAEALQEAVQKMNSDNKDTIISQLLGVINQIPSFIEAGFSDVTTRSAVLKGKIDETESLKKALLEKIRLKEESKADKEELKRKIEDGEITEETFKQRREPGTRPESLATFRKLTQNN